MHSQAEYLCTIGDRAAIRTHTMLYVVETNTRAPYFRISPRQACILGKEVSHQKDKLPQDSGPNVPDATIFVMRKTAEAERRSDAVKAVLVTEPSPRAYAALRTAKRDAVRDGAILSNRTKSRGREPRAVPVCARAPNMSSRRSQSPRRQRHIERRAANASAALRTACRVRWT